MYKFFKQFIFICSFIFTISAHAQSLNFCIIDIYPFGMLENGRIQGAYSDIADYMAQELKLNLTKEIAPYARCSQNVISGKSHVSMMFDSPLLKSGTWQSEALLIFDSVFFVFRCSNDLCQTFKKS